MHMDDLHVDPRLQPIPKGALVDKIALVTGASRGIGAVTARVLAQAGAQVILNYRSKGARAEKVAAEIKAAGGKARRFSAILRSRRRSTQCWTKSKGNLVFLTF